MMEAQAIISGLLAQGLVISVASGKLKVVGACGLTPREREALRSHKPEIIHLLRARESVRRDLLTLYRTIGQHSTADLARWESDRPGFKAQWQRIEHAFSSAWRCGQDCGLEMEALRRLFRQTQRKDKK